MHTPGPWTVTQGWSQSVGDCYVIQECSTHEEEMLANAKLIAAAPELLQALGMLYSETKSYIEINNLGEAHHNWAMNLARAAIRKAVTGRPEDADAQTAGVVVNTKENL